jgi:hypothetical protein
VREIKRERGREGGTKRERERERERGKDREREREREGERERKRCRGVALDDVTVRRENKRE